MLHLEKHPPILDTLIEKGYMETTEKLLVLSAIQDGAKGFAGEIAVEKKFVTPEQLDDALSDLAHRRAVSAVQDIQDIAKEGKQEPKWAKANWGNNGVNKAKENPGISDGISVAAVNALNMVMIANEHPEMADELKRSVSAAANLARGLYQGDSKEVPLKKMSGAWSAEMQRGLAYAVAKTGYQPMDMKGNSINIEDYLKERDTELKAALTIALHGQDKEKIPAVTR